jgi:hypothetical protein
MQCCETLCKNSSDDPKRDGWTFFEFTGRLAQKLKDGWRCQECSKGIRQLLLAEEW